MERSTILNGEIHYKLVICYITMGKSIILNGKIMENPL